ncbi:hypothetical protein [Chondromyces crocatus]|nr:hypothetical protein [Chondromyces crocatus]
MRPSSTVWLVVAVLHVASCALVSGLSDFEIATSEGDEEGETTAPPGGSDGSGGATSSSTVTTTGGATSGDAGGSTSAAGGSGGTGGETPAPVCGDGILDAGESCDDSNVTPGDGCSIECAVESGYTCSGEPSTCSDIDECALETLTCGINAECVNLLGSAECWCADGYQVDPWTACPAPSPCDDGTYTCPLNHYCEEWQGGYRCCPEGGGGQRVCLEN